jgi:hypothetical protein
MFFLYALMLAAMFQQAAAETDPADFPEIDANSCRLDVPGYMRFAMAIDGEEQLARTWGWKKIASPSSFMAEYDLPKPITVAGSYSTRRIAFTRDAILAVLNVADPAIVARADKIDNSMSAQPMIDAMVASGKVIRAQAKAEFPFRKFLGERIMTDVTEPAGKDDYGSHMVVARTISNVTTHPAKTLYGCA